VNTGLTSKPQNNDKYYEVRLLEKIIQDDDVELTFIYAMLLVIQFARVLFIFRASKYFGKMLEIFISMISDLLKFLVIFFIILVIFIGAGRTLFFDIDPFDTFETALIYLIRASLGDFDYDDFEESNVLDHHYGYIYLTLFLVIANVTLLNFLIAILSDIYSIIQMDSTVLYFQQIVLMRCVLNNDKHYSSIVYGIAPFNFLILPFSPFIICK
jgi:hypothetical protein